MPCDFIQLIINNGCKYLSLYEAKLTGTLSLKKSSQLKYLDLSNCNADTKVLEELLASCHSLEKLSLYKLVVTSKIIKSVCSQNGQTLKILVLSQCLELKLEDIRQIIDNCYELTDINFDVTYLPKEATDYLANTQRLTQVTKVS